MRRRGTAKSEERATSATELPHPFRLARSPLCLLLITLTRMNHLLPLQPPAGYDAETWEGIVNIDRILNIDLEDFTHTPHSITIPELVHSCGTVVEGEPLSGHFELLALTGSLSGVTISGIKSIVLPNFHAGKDGCKAVLKNLDDIIYRKLNGETATLDGRTVFPGEDGVYRTVITAYALRVRIKRKAFSFLRS